MADMSEKSGFEPLLCDSPRMLVLGSLPGDRSLAEDEYYAHPSNRFWKVLAAVTDQETPRTIPEKKEFLLRNGIALWDVIASCDIQGSSDSSIRNVVPNDLSEILRKADIRLV